MIRSTSHEFVKAARFTVLGLVLVEEGNAGLVEFGEEFVPADPVEPFVGRIEIDAQDAGVSVLLRSLDRRGLSTALLRPFPDDVVAGGLLGFAGLCLDDIWMTCDTSIADKERAMDRPSRQTVSP
ncbi:hypothetical protein ACVWYI_005420 [Bradyrhizobium sp. LB13.1]